MFAELTRRLRKALRRVSPRATGATDTGTTDSTASKEKQIDFEAVLCMAAEHHEELAHTCLLPRPSEDCTRCQLAAASQTGLHHFEAGDLTTQQRQKVLHLAFAYCDGFLHTCGGAEVKACTLCVLEELGNGHPSTHTTLATLLARWEQQCPSKENGPRKEPITLDHHSFPLLPLLSAGNLLRGITPAVARLVALATKLLSFPVTQQQTRPAKHPHPLLVPYSAPVHPPHPSLRITKAAPIPAWRPVPLTLTLPPHSTIILHKPPTNSLYKQGCATLPEALLRQAIRVRSEAPHTCNPHLQDPTCIHCLLARLAFLLGLP